MKIKKFFITLFILILIIYTMPISFASVNESDLDITSEAALLIDNNTGKIYMEKMKMKKNLELILLIINWVIVAIQAFTIFLYGNSIGLFIIMLLALIAQVFSVYDNRKK